MVAARYSLNSGRVINCGANGPRKVRPRVSDTPPDIFWMVRVNRGSGVRASVEPIAAGVTGLLGTGRFVGSGAGVAGCFVAGDAGLAICSGLGSVASEELTVGDGLGRRVAVGVGFAVRVGRRVGVAAPMGPARWSRPMPPASRSGSAPTPETFPASILGRGHIDGDRSIDVLHTSLNGQCSTGKTIV